MDGAQGLDEERDGKTKVTVRQSGFPSPDSEDAHTGWNESFDKLAASLKLSRSERPA